MSDRKNKNSGNNLDDYVTAMKSFDDNTKENESPKKDDYHEDMGDNEHEGHREERRKSLETALMQTMDPFV
ncbi:hypothetical protein HA402_011059 [Bradysia odoriphaga]|nr:hypothetical protein HA402_011059 [Bradysia odoriphaga]